MIVPIIAALIIAIKVKKSFYFSTFTVCIGCALSMLVMCIAVYLETGSDILTLIDGWFKDFLQQNGGVTKLYYLSLSSAVTGEMPDAQSILNYDSISLDTAVDFVYGYMGQSVIYGALQFMAGFSAIGGLCIFLIVRAVAKKCGADVVSVPPFSRFFLPKYFGRTSVVILIFVTIGYVCEWRNFDYVYSIFMALFCSIYFVQGLAFLDFLLARKINSGAGRGAILFVIVLVSLLIFQLFLPILGLIEEGAKARKRALERENKK